VKGHCNVVETEQSCCKPCREASRNSIPVITERQAKSGPARLSGCEEFAVNQLITDSSSPLENDRYLRAIDTDIRAAGLPRRRLRRGRRPGTSRR
jgi:hypothetical protein